MNNEHPRPSQAQLGSVDLEARALYGAIIVNLARVYDVLLMMYSEMNKEEAEILRAAHRQGHLYAPPPSFRMDESDESDDTDSSDDIHE